MRLTRLILTALAIAVCVPSIGLSQYTPQWKVGDWWVVKEWNPGMASGWQHKRYDVLRTEKLGEDACYVLQYGDTASPGSGTRTLYYVRCDNWLTVRSDDYLENQGQVIGPIAMDFPDGMFGPFPAEPLMPPFPLDPATSRSAAKVIHGGGGPLDPLRRYSLLADSAALSSYRADPDSAAGRPVQPRTGSIYVAMSELVTPSDSEGLEVPFRYNLQLWSGDCPWRLYEELGDCDPVTGARQPEEQSWLIAWGNSKK